MSGGAQGEACGLSVAATPPAARRGDARIALVPREALAETVSPTRRYRSRVRTARAERTAATIEQAALALVQEGNFRPTLSQVAARAGVGANRINAHFGYIHLLWRVLAREHGDAVAEAACLPMSIHPGLRSDLVWVIMTGATRETWAARERGGAHE